jgi:hypothetical protein
MANANVVAIAHQLSFHPLKTVSVMSDVAQTVHVYVHAVLIMVFVHVVVLAQSFLLLR